MPPQSRTAAPERFDFDVIVVGAGAAGIGMGRALCDLGVDRFLIVDRHGVGASFLKWPREMRLISPSFPGNAFGQLDLNAVTHDTSPGYTYGREHLSGKAYADYLRDLVQRHDLPVLARVEISHVTPLKPAGFRVETRNVPLTARFVIWAAGEFQYPNLNPFPGAELCVHNATVASWKDLEGDEFVVIGGYESGSDAASHLVRLGKSVTVLEPEDPWEGDDKDPSRALSPYTLQRIDRALATDRLELVSGVRVSQVLKRRGKYRIETEQGQTWQVATRPIMATGFTSSLERVRRLFRWSKAGHALLSVKCDESTKTPGLFVSGPMIRHKKLILCFVYKFRQRFAVVAAEIARRLGVDPEPFLEPYRKANMYLEDLSCCESDCIC